MVASKSILMSGSSLFPEHPYCPNLSPQPKCLHLLSMSPTLDIWLKQGTPGLAASLGGKDKRFYGWSPIFFLLTMPCGDWNLRQHYAVLMGELCSENDTLRSQDLDLDESGVLGSGLDIAFGQEFFWLNGVQGGLDSGSCRGGGKDGPSAAERTRGLRVVLFTTEEGLNKTLLSGR